MNLLTQALIAEARLSIGVHEVGGNNKGPEVEAWLARLHLPPGSPWCMAFQWCKLDDACKKLGLKNAVKPIGGVVRMYEHLSDVHSPSPTVGCWGFHCDPVNPTHGHVVLVTDVFATNVASLEANTNQEGSREGDSVWTKIRPLSYFNLGFADPAQAVLRSQPTT